MSETREGDVMSEFDVIYKDTLPWEIGRAQREFSIPEERGRDIGSILGVGCITEGTRFSSPDRITGCSESISARRLSKRRWKDEMRERLRIEFKGLDALKLSELKEQPFGNAIDCGLFHALGD